MRELRQHFERQRSAMVALIRQLVELESPSNNKPAADHCAAFLARELQARGAVLKIHRQKHAGDYLEARFPGRGKPILLLGHYDTVWDVGTLGQMPWCETHGKLYGPGVFDMKAGIAIMLFAVAGLREVRGRLSRPLIISLCADEEVGSPGSRAITERLARPCQAVLVLEPAMGTAVKTARKGAGEFTLKVTGVAAHAGLDFAAGHSAVLELARQIERVSGFTDLRRGVTVNVGVIRGGTRANVVAAEAVAEVDVRITGRRDQAAIEQKFRFLRPNNRHCRLEVTGCITRPPMERTQAVAALYRQARSIAGELGFELDEAAAGGTSDGNWTAALGIPTLDGLGAVGEGAHARHESVRLEWLPRRAALLAGLLERI